MQRISILLFLLVVCFATTMQAQTQAPKPDPALMKLHALLGRWMFIGEYKTGPLGPGGKFTREYTGQMILGGFFFRGRWSESGALGEAQGFEMDGYDPVNKNFTCSAFWDNGIRASAVLTADGNAFRWEGKVVVAGEQYQFKEAWVFAGDLMSGTSTVEISADGKTWTPLVEAKFSKAKPAPKK